MLIHAPPCAIHRIEHVGPGRQFERGVGYDDASAFLRLPPRFDFLNVVCGEAWAAGDADDLAPPAFTGSAPGLTISTRPACSSFFA